MGAKRGHARPSSFIFIPQSSVIWSDVGRKKPPLKANYVHPPKRAAWHGECFSSAPSEKKWRKVRASDALEDPCLKSVCRFHALFCWGGHVVFVFFPTISKIGLIPVTFWMLHDIFWIIVIGMLLVVSLSLTTDSWPSQWQRTWVTGAPWALLGAVWLAFRRLSI